MPIAEVRCIPIGERVVTHNKTIILGIAVFSAAFMLDSLAVAQNVYNGRYGNSFQGSTRRFSNSPTFQAPTNIRTPIYSYPQTAASRQFYPQTGVQSQRYSSGFRGSNSTRYPSNIPYQSGTRVYGNTYPYAQSPGAVPYSNRYYGQQRTYGGTYYGTPSQLRGANIGGSIGTAINGQQGANIGAAIGSAVGRQ